MCVYTVEYLDDAAVSNDVARMLLLLFDLEFSLCYLFGLGFCLENFGLSSNTEAADWRMKLSHRTWNRLKSKGTRGGPADSVDGGDPLKHPWHLPAFGISRSCGI